MKSQLTQGICKSEFLKFSLIKITFSFLLFLQFTDSLISQPKNIYFKSCTNKLNFTIPDGKSQVYQIPLSVYDIPDNSKLLDLDLGLTMKHNYTNALQVCLISPNGLRSTLFTINSCPGALGENIDVVFDDQAFDIAYWNSTYTLQNKNGVKIPANFTCLSNKTTSIGSYNSGTAIGTGITYTKGHMRPQSDHLKTFNQSKIRTNIPPFKLNLLDTQIDAFNNQLSGPQIADLISSLELLPNDKITLKYVNAIGQKITGLNTSYFYIFKVINPNTIALDEQDPLFDIENVVGGTQHLFTWYPNWVLEVYNLYQFTYGKVTEATLDITYQPPVMVNEPLSGKIKDSNIFTREANFNQELFQVTQNYPNPYSSVSNIDFYLPESGIVEIQIFTPEGRVVFETKNRYDKGKNTFIVPDFRLNRNNMLFYSFKNQDKLIIKSMLYKAN